MNLDAAKETQRLKDGTVLGQTAIRSPLIVIKLDDPHLITQHAKTVDPSGRPWRKFIWGWKEEGAKNEFSPKLVVGIPRGNKFS